MTDIARYVSIPRTNTSIPRPGFGVFQLYGDSCVQNCEDALKLGYRHIDSALIYRNEADIGIAVRNASSKIPREDLFLTTKIIKGQGSPEKTYQQMLQCVEDLNGEAGGKGQKDHLYADLFLIHNPDSGRATREELWLALERLYHEGKAKAIGVSNFRVNHLEEMKEYATIWPPHVNQIELHPWCQQRELVKYCEDHGIVLEAYSPLAVAENLTDPVVERLAAKYVKSPAQVLLRYSLQKGWVPLPKSQTTSRIKENMDLFGFALEPADMQILDNLDRGPDGAIFSANVSHGLQ